MRKYTLLFTILLTGICLQAQQIQNVQANQQGKTIIVSYDLTGTTGDYEVNLFCSTDGGSTFGTSCKSLTGDAGKTVKAGNNKQIAWNVLADREKLTGNCILFEVRASPVNKILNDLGIEMVYVKGGTFTMGCTSEQGSDCEDDEKPAHPVTLSDFYIGKYEVTQKQWRQVMGASNSLSNPSYFEDCDSCPVESISWNDVQEFIKKMNLKTRMTYRLPTEAEWEYAARGGASGAERNRSTDYKYSGSNNVDEVAWYKSNSTRIPHPVGQKMPNELGIYDMSGNVWEWCSDWYGSYSSKIQTNSEGATSGSGRVLRGGSWGNDDLNCRASNRGHFTTNNRDYYSGFRIVSSR